MPHRCLLAALVALLLVPALARAAEPIGEQVLDRFVGAWRNEISRRGPRRRKGEN